MRTVRTLFAAPAAVALLALGACGGDDTVEDVATTTTAADDSSATTATAPNFGAAVTVMLKDIKFAPAEVSIKKGEEVRWLWAEELPHNVVGKGFESKTQSEGEFRHTFKESGKFEYKCTVHPGMEGTVTVS